jgi:hypothetical protein
MSSNLNGLAAPRRLALALAAGLMLAPVPGLAFTIENGDGSGGGAIPKFDMDEQLRNFRTPTQDSLTTPKRDLQTPFGSMQFDVRQGSAFSPWGSSMRAQEDRRHFDRMFDPQARFDSR